MIAAKLEALGITARIVEGELIVEGSRELTEAETEWIAANWEALWLHAGGPAPTLACSDCACIVADNPRQLAELKAKHGATWAAWIDRLRAEASPAERARWGRCLRCQLRDQPPLEDDTNERDAIQQSEGAFEVLAHPHIKGRIDQQEAARG